MLLIQGVVSAVSPNFSSQIGPLDTRLRLAIQSEMSLGTVQCFLMFISGHFYLTAIILLKDGHFKPMLLKNNLNKKFSKSMLYEFPMVVPILPLVAPILYL